MADIEGLTLDEARWLAETLASMAGSCDDADAYRLVASVLDDLERKDRRWSGPEMFRGWLRRAVELRTDPVGTGDGYPDADTIRELVGAFEDGPREEAPQTELAEAVLAFGLMPVGGDATAASDVWAQLSETDPATPNQLARLRQLAREPGWGARRPRMEAWAERTIGDGELSERAAYVLLGELGARLNGRGQA